MFPTKVGPETVMQFAVWCERCAKSVKACSRNAAACGLFWSRSSRRLLTELARHSYLGVMARHKNDILQGTLLLLVLKTLGQGRMHGYAITSHIQRVSADLLRVEEGSLYPALHRMAQEGWVRAEWGMTEKNREAKFYTITAAGRKQLEVEDASWARLRTGVTRVLRYA